MCRLLMKLTTWLALAAHGPTQAFSPWPKTKTMPVRRLRTTRPPSMSRYSSLILVLPGSGAFST